jgi:hypothetical protein
MRLATVYTRFFRSLNYDFLRASAPGYEPAPWDRMPDSSEYPFVTIDLESDITTVVGGNESGKSQVLAAVSAALNGQGYDRSDFCRYSPFFATDKTFIMPEFGMLYSDVDLSDVQVIKSMCGWKDLQGQVERLAIFRMNTTPQLRAYVRQHGEWLPAKHIKNPSMLRELGLPIPFTIDADTPLPDSVPLDFLATGKTSTLSGRKFLRGIWDSLARNVEWFDSSETVTKQSSEIARLFSTDRQLDSSDLQKYQLAADLLLTVTGLQRGLFVELQTAVRTKSGYANSIVDTINAELAKSLNFPHWWSQDSQFELFVHLHEFDLIFMIRDRTGRSYGFEERSDGLKYFLSYFVQYLSHTPADSKAPELLLMDEPDKYLSSSGQQDLLRIFQDFAHPRDAKRQPVQVLYVTHSPFLIDKNHSERVRVLQKGEHDEGTRVVDSVAQNHYEPLRSAFGSFVGETTFIGTCNLMLEGPSDQIILAGISSWLGVHGTPDLQRLDLNNITLVPAGGCSQIPYLVYLARGRDVEQPPVIVLLDGDKPGDDARKEIRRGGATLCCS